MIAYLLSVIKFDRSILLYILAWSIIGFIHLGINLVLVNLYVLRLGFDISFLGVLNGSGQVIWALTALPAGMIGTRFGLRNSLAAGFAIISIGLACFLGTAWLPQSIWAPGMLISNGLSWIGAGLVVVNGTPYLMAVVSEQDRSKAFTLQGAFFTLAAFLGSLAAGLLPAFLMTTFPGGMDEAAAYNAVMWLAVPAYLVSALLMLKCRQEPASIQAAQSRGSERAPVGLLVFLGVLFILQVSSENAVAGFINVYFASSLATPSAAIGTIFAIARLVPFILSPLQPLALNRWGSGRVMIASYALIGVCAVFIALVPTGLAAAVGFILFILIISFASTARTLYGQESVQPRWRTSVTAVMTISLATGGGLVGFNAGYIIASAGFRGLFLTSAVLALLVVSLYTLRQRLVSRQHVAVRTEIVAGE